MPLPFFAIGAALGAANAAGRFFSGGKQKNLANQINPVFNPYQASPYAKKRLGLANNLFNGRMFGAPQLERNIFSNQASAVSNINKNATDASQALSFGAAAQGQTNDALTNLQTLESQNKYQTLNNLNAAYEGMVNEGDKEYDSMRYKYEQDVAQKNALMDAAMNNKYGAVSDLSSLGIQLSGLVGGVGSRRQNGVSPLNENGGGVTDRTKINIPDVGTGRPTPYYRPMGRYRSNYVAKYPDISFPKYNQIFYPG